MARTRQQQLSIYLLKDHIANAAGALRQGAQYDAAALPDDFPASLSLFVRPSVSNPPAWVRYLPVATQNQLQALYTASAGAVIFVEARGRLFAVCFGTGWHLLKKDVIIRSFGLRAALALVDPTTLQAVDISTYDNFAKYRRVSTSKGTTMESFDIEGQLDLLRGVVGVCSRSALAVKIGGRDPCILWTRTEMDQLPKLCAVLLRAYASKRVEQRYPVIDNVSQVRDPAENARLDSVLDAVLAANPNHDVTVAPSEVVNWDDVQAFTVDHAGAPPPVVDIQFAAIKNLYGPGALTVQDLRSLDVGTIKPDGAAGPQRWSAYDCCVTEIDDPNDPNVRCILMAGDWYVVAATFVQQVSQDLQAIPGHTARALPDAHAGEIEPTYNARVVAADAANLSLLDAKVVSYGGGRSRIEVCDFLSSASQLYHIKDYHGSATLSHLFSQATVSARLLLEQDFRDEVRAKFGAAVQQVIPSANFSPNTYEVVIGIICKQARNIPGDLPFFSKVRLMEAARELRRMGFTNVSTIKIRRQ